MMKNIKSIAVTGKGGTGKTVLATLLIRILSHQFPGHVLAIDADSAMSLPYTLGVPVVKTVGDLRNNVLGPQQLKRQLEHQSSEDIIRNLVTTGPGFDLLAIGRPEAPGCFCVVNDLLKYGIEFLTEEYDITIIDGEAGPEQLNRRVLSAIDVLLVVSDMSARSLKTAAGIVDVARRRGENGIQVQQAGLVLNRVRHDKAAEELVKNVGIEVYGCLPEDNQINQYDREDRKLLDLPDDSPCLKEVQHILQKIFSDK